MPKPGSLPLPRVSSYTLYLHTPPTYSTQVHSCGCSTSSYVKLQSCFYLTVRQTGWFILWLCFWFNHAMWVISSLVAHRGKFITHMHLAAGVRGLSGNSWWFQLKPPPTLNKHLCDWWCSVCVQTWTSLCFAGSVVHISDTRISHIGPTGPGGLVRNVRCTYAGDS